jgi:hypothetical protein
MPVQISHIKMGNRNVWGKSAEAIKIVNEARTSGFDITADAYSLHSMGIDNNRSRP